jgi:hypothetical protein
MVCAVAAVVAAALWATAGIGGAAGTVPADKVTVTGAKPDITSAGSAPITLLGPVQVRTATPEDLVFHVTAECAILTTITNTGNQVSSASGQVRVWVEVDGQPVPVVPGHPGTGDNGKVVFCNREFRRTTAGLTPQETITDYMNTREANGFNWASLDSGNGIHTIEVKGDFTKTATNGMADAVIGNRTLVVEPTKVQSQP